MLLAVMDLGSNSFKMTVAQWAPELSRTRPFRILHKERHPIQLGASVFSQGKISSKDFKEGVRAIKKMQERLRDFASPILRVVATSAIRDSSNGREFVRYVNEELALPIEVITGAEEASLISRGLQWEFPKVSRGLLIDIGGGSTEVASFGTSAQDLYCQSYRIGSVRVTMKFFKKKVNKDSLPRIRSQIRATLKDPPKFKFEKVVGSAGTIQSLGQIFGLGLGLKSIKLIELDRWILANLNASPQSIVKRFKVQPSRARVLVAGALVLSEVLHWLGQSELNVTGMTLRDGVLVDLVSHWKDELVTDDHRLSESSFNRIQTLGISKELLSFLEATAQKYHVDLGHARHVAALSLLLYKQIQEALPLGLQGAEEKRYLTIVSYLHDIGKIVSDAGHQKHSAYIIRNLRIPGCSPLESKKLALIALYHRKESPPKKDPLPFGVSGVHADQTRRLTAILRIADGLDEFDIQNVRDLKFKITGKQAMIELKQQNPEALSDLGYFREKASYFEELFGLKLTTFVSAQRREH